MVDPARTPPSAIVTGGTRGIGLAIAGALGAAGHAVLLVYRSDAAAAATAEAELRAAGCTARAHAADVTDPAAAAGVVEAARALGPLRVLVNNAFQGGRVPRKTHEVPLDELREDLWANVGGPAAMAQACLPDMRDAGFGRIVFIGSLAMRGESGRVAYATAKAALTGLSGTLAREYARDGITSNVVNPGFIDAGAFVRLPEEVRARAVKTVPMRRAGTGEEVAETVAFLCSEGAGYLTGQVLGVDGGAR